MSQVWYRNNKAAEKFSEEDIILILEDTLQYLKDNPEIFLKVDLGIYMMEKHGVVPSTRSSWTNKIHINNRSIMGLWKLIADTIESRLVKKEKGIRPNIQAMVLQNKHGYTDKQEQKITAGAEIIINRPSYEPKEQTADKETTE